MKRILRSLCTLLMLVVWASGFAAEKTYSYTFKSGDFSAKKKTSTLNGVNWTLAVDSWKGSESYAWDSSKQSFKIGKGKNDCPNKNVTITTSEITGTIKSVTVNCSTNSGASTQLKVLVGGTQMGKQVSLTNSSTNYDFKGTAKGTIVLSFSDSNTPLYLKSINVVFEDGPTKTATTLTFTNSTINIEEGNEANFAAQTAILKTGETVLNKVVTYTTNNDAMFEAYEANVGPKALKVGAYGTAVVTAKFAGDDTYAASTATYTVNYTEKVKPATTLDFGFATKSVNINESFTAPATLKAGETVISGAVTYTSSNSEVADVDKTTGEVLAYAAGKATITATFAGTNEYKGSTASYELTVVDPNAPDNIVFDAATKGFDDMIETYKYPSGTNNAAFKTKDGKTYAFSYRNCMRNNAKGNNPDVIQMRNNKNGKGTFTSPVFDEMPNGYKVNVYYGIIEGHKPLTITSNEETSATSISNAYGDKNKTDGTGYCTSIILANGSSFTVNVGGSTCYVSKIEILPLSAPITLDEAADDTDTKIENNKGKTVDVTLTRTLTAGVWNTICLPFDVTAEQIADVLKSEGNVKEYGSEDVNKQTIYFKEATIMTAGTPYLIKPTEDAKELVFKGVTIKNVDAVDRKVGDKYKMCGVFGKYAMNTNGTELFLKTDSKFYVPAVGKETMKGFRAYFLVPKSQAGAALNLSFGDATGINGVAADAEKNVKVYNVNGQYVGTSLEALPKGLYIVGGKKVLK